MFNKALMTVTSFQLEQTPILQQQKTVISINSSHPLEETDVWDEVF